MSEWIDIKDKLPELKTWIIGSTYKRMLFGVVNSITILQDMKGNFCLAMEVPQGAHLEFLITHWMPVPNLPKGPSNEGPKDMFTEKPH